MYKRKTVDEYRIFAKDDLKAYRENQLEYAVKMIKRRIKI
jgi:hypothetical protein